MYVYGWMDVYGCIWMYVCMYGCMDAWMAVCLHEWMHVCINLSFMDGYVYICMYCMCACKYGGMVTNWFRHSFCNAESRDLSLFEIVAVLDLEHIFCSQLLCMIDALMMLMIMLLLLIMMIK